MHGCIGLHRKMKRCRSFTIHWFASWFKQTIKKSGLTRGNPIHETLYNFTVVVLLSVWMPHNYVCFFETRERWPKTRSVKVRGGGVGDVLQNLYSSSNANQIPLHVLLCIRKYSYMLSYIQQAHWTIKYRITKCKSNRVTMRKLDCYRCCRGKLVVGESRVRRLTV